MIKPKRERGFQMHYQKIGLRKGTLRTKWKAQLKRG